MSQIYINNVVVVFLSQKNIYPFGVAPTPKNVPVYIYKKRPPQIFSSNQGVIIKIKKN